MTAFFEKSYKNTRTIEEGRWYPQWPMLYFAPLVEAFFLGCSINSHRTTTSRIRVRTALTSTMPSVGINVKIHTIPEPIPRQRVAEQKLLKTSS